MGINIRALVTPKALKYNIQDRTNDFQKIIVKIVLKSNTVTLNWFELSI